MGRVLQSHLHLITVEEFYQQIRDGEKADLIDGVIYMASPDSKKQNKIGLFLQSLMQSYASINDLGETFGSRFAFRLSSHRAPEPDVAFVSKDRLSLVHETGMNGAPDIAVEIVSKESKKRDYQEKKRVYEESGVLEYWIIDPLQERATFYGLVAKKYEPIFLQEGHIFCSRVLKGFMLDANWLWEDPLPNIHEKLALAVGGKKLVQELGKSFTKEEILKWLEES